MKDQKTIETNTPFPDVLAYVSRTKKGNPCVVIHAMGFSNGNPDIVVSVVIKFVTMEFARDYIRDFSVESANNFCDRNNLEFHK